MKKYINCPGCQANCNIQITKDAFGYLNLSFDNRYFLCPTLVTLVNRTKKPDRIYKALLENKKISIQKGLEILNSVLENEKNIIHVIDRSVPQEEIDKIFSSFDNNRIFSGDIHPDTISYFQLPHENIEKLLSKTHRILVIGPLKKKNLYLYTKIRKDKKEILSVSTNKAIIGETLFIKPGNLSIFLTSFLFPKYRKHFKIYHKKYENLAAFLSEKPVLILYAPEIANDYDPLLSHLILQRLSYKKHFYFPVTKPLPKIYAPPFYSFINDKKIDNTVIIGHGFYFPWLYPAYTKILSYKHKLIVRNTSFPIAPYAPILLLPAKEIIERNYTSLKNQNYIHENMFLNSDIIYERFQRIFKSFEHKKKFTVFGFIEKEEDFFIKDPIKCFANPKDIKLLPKYNKFRLKTKKAIINIDLVSDKNIERGFLGINTNNILSKYLMDVKYDKFIAWEIPTSGDIVK